jgi:hypothetical protein
LLSVHRVLWLPRIEAGHRRRLTHDRARYEGKNLLRLLLALTVPSLLLYLRLVLAIAASPRAMQASYVVLLVFLAAQAVAARRIQYLFRPTRTRMMDALQFLAVFTVCLFFSVCGAIACEAFGYAVFLRFARLKGG